MREVLALAGLLGLLVAPAAAPGQVTCRPNIFGGQDCR